MKLLGSSAALLALAAQVMGEGHHSVEDCKADHPQGSAALGRCIKAYNKAARAMEQSNFRANKEAEQAAFHARAKAQKDGLRDIKDLRSEMQKTGQTNKADNKDAKNTATQVWAENRKQALMQFAFKRMGLRMESHVCRKDGSDVAITAGDVSAGGTQDVNFAIEQDDITGKFWLLVKSGPDVSLTSLSVDIATGTEMKNSYWWNVQVEEEYHGDKNVDAIATMASESEFTSDNIWWFYCAERRPKGSNGQTFPMVTTEPEESEPTCGMGGCKKAYINNGGVKGWVVWEDDSFTTLPDGVAEEDVCVHAKPFVYASMAQDAMSCADFIAANPCVSMVTNYAGISINGACGTLNPVDAEFHTIREVGPDGALTMFYDSVNSFAIGNVAGDVNYYSNSDCTGDSSTTSNTASDSNDFTANYLVHPVQSISAVGIACIDISNIPGKYSMNVVSDSMKWGMGAWVWIRLMQPTPFHHTRMRVDYYGASNIGKFHVHSYQSDNLRDCKTVGGHYNPLGVDLSQSSNKDQETYEVGDLSGKHGRFDDWGVTDDAGSKMFHDVNLPIWGMYSVAARGLVLHHKDTGARAACGNLGHMCAAWDRQPKIDQVRIDYTGDDVWGYQVLQQRKGCPWCATSVKSYFRYKDAEDEYWTDVCADDTHALHAVCATGSGESKFHIHTIRDEVFEWGGCANNGGHYNPQVGVPCMSGYQGPNSDLCELGDLNNKMGKLTISNLGWTTSQKTDLYAPLTESSQGYAFSNRSITVHAPSGARMTCGPTDLSWT